MRFRIIPLLTLVLVSGWSAPTQAREDLVPGSRYTSARAAGMGDAYLPIGDDGASGMFYNPADLGRIKTAHSEFWNLSMYANSGYAKMIDANFFKVTSLSSFAPTLQLHPGVFAGAGGALLPNFYTRGFAFGILMQSEMGAQSNADGSTRYRSLYQFVPTLATGIRLAQGIVRLGYSLQWVNQASGDITLPAGTSPVGYNQGISQGSTFSHNVGFALTLPMTYLPAVNVVARNLLSANFNSVSIVGFARNTSGPPPTEQPSYDASFSLQPKLGGGDYVNMVAEYRDLSNVSGVSPIGRAALGLELSMHDFFFLRAGFRSGYPSAGIGMRQGKGEFDLAWYSEELGQSFLSQQDTRYMFQYVLHAF